MARLTVTSTQQSTSLTLVFMVLRLILKSVFLNKTFRSHPLKSPVRQAPVRVEESAKPNSGKSFVVCFQFFLCFAGMYMKTRSS